jgi:hypothetical protein
MLTSWALISCCAVAKEINDKNNFFWSASTKSVINVSAQAFEGEFFQAYDNFKAIRESDVSSLAVLLKKTMQATCNCQVYKHGYYQLKMIWKRHCIGRHCLAQLIQVVASLL